MSASGYAHLHAGDINGNVNTINCKGPCFRFYKKMSD